MGEIIRTRLDLLKESDEEASRENLAARNFEIGDQVQIRNYDGTRKWNFGKVSAKEGSLHYWIDVEGGKRERSHVDQMRKTDISGTSPEKSTVRLYGWPFKNPPERGDVRPDRTQDKEGRDGSLITSTREEGNSPKTPALDRTRNKEWNVEHPPLRRSTRQRRPPDWFRM